jgi:hypothetical protein
MYSTTYFFLVLKILLVVLVLISHKICTREGIPGTRTVGSEGDEGSLPVRYSVSYCHR